MSKSVLFKSSLARKYWMALTGLFLCLFLVGHLLGNLQLLRSDISSARDQFNEYALFMTTNPAVKALSYLTYLSILLHIVDGILLTIRNKKARKTPYVVHKGHANSSWNSRNMGVLGTIILFFIVTHMWMFWGEMHFGEMSHYTTAGGSEVKDLYTLTVKTFQADVMGLVWVIAYGISMLALGFHLHHGFASAFQSLGIRHRKLSCIIEKTGGAFAVVVAFAFAIIPFYVRFVLKTL